jgi:hypothetical protein
MALRFLFLRRKGSRPRGRRERFLIGVALAGLAGCRGAGRTDDPQLKPIQAMLEAQLPPHTPEAKVVAFLGNRGYPILPAQKQGTIVANIRRTDTAMVQPVIARVTFYFDANRTLNTFEVQRPVTEPDKR